MRNSYSKLLTIIAIIFLGAIAYSNSFHNSFQLDDFVIITDNPVMKDIRNIQNIWNFWPTRFITYISITLNYQLGGLEVFGYHVFNFIIHLACAIAVWWLVLLTVKRPLIAFFAGAVFLLHPVQTQPVNYIVQRATLLAAFFYIMSVCLYVKARLKVEGRPNSQAWKIYYAGSVLSAVMSMFSKEMAISLPLIICLYEFYFFRAKRTFNWKYVIAFLIIILVIPLTMLMTKSVNFFEMHRVSEARANMSMGNYFLTQLRVMVTYLRIVFIPANLNLDYDYPIAKTIFSSPVILSLLFLLLILITSAKLSKKYKLVSFGIFWFFITLLPESSVIPITDVIFEHRLYLPMAGFSLFLAGALYYLFKGRRIKVITVSLSLLLVCYSALTYQRNKVWKDEFSLWNDVIHKSPDKARPYNSRGNAYALKESFDEALSDYTRAIEINPNYAEACYNRGNAYARKENFDEALSDYTRAIKINPNYAYAYSNRGNTYACKGDYDKAISDYSQAIEINPNDATARHNREVAYAKKRNKL